MSARHPSRIAPSRSKPAAFAPFIVAIFEYLAGRSGGRIEPIHLLQEARLSHFRERIEGVVTGRPVVAERDVDISVEVVPDRGAMPLASFIFEDGQWVT